MGTFTKGVIGKQDLEGWDGTSTKTFTRDTSEGYDMTLNAIDWPGVDVLKEYGGNVNRTDTTISSAMTGVGAVNQVPFWISPGSWVIDDNLTITANITLICPPGVDLAVSASKTLTINGKIMAGPYAIFSGSGLATYNHAGITKAQPEWWSATPVNNSSNASSGTGEDTLASFTVPAGSMGTVGGIHLMAVGDKTGLNGNKTIKFYFGSTTVTFSPAQNNENEWMLELFVWNTAAAAQRIYWRSYDGITNGVIGYNHGYETATEDTTAAVTMKLTGTCAHASDVITQRLGWWERI